MLRYCIFNNKEEVYYIIQTKLNFTKYLMKFEVIFIYNIEYAYLFQIFTIDLFL